LDHEALWRWLRELSVPDIDLLQDLYSGAYYQADLPYGRSAELRRPIARAEEGRQIVSTALWAHFNALFLALKATWVGHRAISGSWHWPVTAARGFADGLELVARSAVNILLFCG
jgi:hypothetical protein